MTEAPLKVIADPKTKYGNGLSETRWFVVQRLTGLANIVFLGFLVWFVARLGSADQATMVATIRNPWVWVPLLLMVINVPLHMRIGMREIIEDYVHEPRTNRFALMANTYFALVIGLIGIVSVLKIAFWG